MTRPGVGSPTSRAALECSGCGQTHFIGLRVLLPEDQIDKKFVQAGWQLDPHRCPDCIKSKKDAKRTMTAKPTPAAMRAQVAMTNMLTEHFDKAAGAYAAGWSDDKIAADTGLAVDHVCAFRIACFGELKEPAEVGQFRADLKAIEELAKGNAADIAQAIAELRAQLARLSAKWGA